MFAQIVQCRGSISSRCPSNSEANASELLGYLEEYRCDSFKII